VNGLCSDLAGRCGSDKKKDSADEAAYIATEHPRIERDGENWSASMVTGRSVMPIRLLPFLGTSTPVSNSNSRSQPPTKTGEREVKAGAEEARAESHIAITSIETGVVLDNPEGFKNSDQNRGQWLATNMVLPSTGRWTPYRQPNPTSGYRRRSSPESADASSSCGRYGCAISSCAVECVVRAAGGLTGALLHSFANNRALSIAFGIILIFVGVSELTGLAHCAGFPSVSSATSSLPSSSHSVHT